MICWKEGVDVLKITFPHLGNATFAAKALFDGLDIDYVIPPCSNKKALELGVLYSPEEICLPYKIMMGNYIQAIEKGADTVVITGSCGPCRYGEYCELQMNSLKKLGYNLDFIVVDNPFSIGKEEFINRISKITCKSEKSNRDKIKAALNAYDVVKLMDKIESKARYLCGFEVNKGECKKLLKECKEKAMLCSTPSEMIDHLKKYLNLVNKVKIDKRKKPIKIAIVGEIYTVLEPFANLYLEDKLMDYGVSTQKMLTPSWWVKDAALSPMKLNSINLRMKSREYLPYYVGGHGRECIGETLLAQRHGFDGVIQVFPLGCMPEIVSKAILPTISRDKNFPIMTLVVDEMTGEGGYVTRIEAFVDLLERRNENVLYGN